MAETAPLPQAPAALPAQRAPVVEIAVGVVLLLTGVVMLVLPSRTLLFVGFAIGVQLVVVGLLRVWVLRAVDLPRRVLVLGYLLALATVAAGVLCMARPGASLLVLAVIAGAGWVADGLVEIAAFATGSGAERGLSLGSGLLSLVAGVALLALPRSSLVTLAQVAGGFLLVLGLAHLLSGGARLRRTTS